MSLKPEKPTLSGQRIKTRKRDEKEKYDPVGFRDCILQGFSGANCSPNDLDAVHKYLDVAGNKLDYRRYADVLFDLLLAGGILAPGGSVISDPRPDGLPGTTEICVFAAKDDAHLKAYANLVIKLIRRYKYLEKSLEDAFGKVMMFMKGFEPEHRDKLATVTALLLAAGLLTPAVLGKLLQDHLVKDGLALSFLVNTLRRWLTERDPTTIWTTLRRAQIDSRLMDFMPTSKRTQEHFQAAFREGGLTGLVEFQRVQAFQTVRRDLQQQVSDQINEGAPVQETVSLIKECQQKCGFSDSDIVCLLWSTLMGLVEWNKKEELVADQSLKYLRQHAPLLAIFSAKSAKAEISLLRAVQDYCYDNMNFMKVFHRIVVLFYKTDVLSEDGILRWYEEAHSPKGKSVFLEQMKKFVEWLQQAEEESEEDAADD